MTEIPQAQDGTLVPPPKDGTKIKDELESIRLNNIDGLLYIKDVVEFAQNPGSAIYDWFESNGAFSEALALKVLQSYLARHLIVRVKVTIMKAPQKVIRVRAYTSLIEDRYNGGGYRLTDDTLKDADQRNLLLNTAFSEFKAMERKYSALDELAPIFAAVNNIPPPG